MASCLQDAFVWEQLERESRKETHRLHGPCNKVRAISPSTAAVHNVGKPAIVEAFRVRLRMGNEALRAPNGPLIRVPVVLCTRPSLDGGKAQMLGWNEISTWPDPEKSRKLSIQNPPGYQHHNRCF